MSRLQSHASRAPGHRWPPLAILRAVACASVVAALSTWGCDDDGAVSGADERLIAASVESLSASQTGGAGTFTIQVSISFTNPSDTSVAGECDLELWTGGQMARARAMSMELPPQTVSTYHVGALGSDWVEHTGEYRLVARTRLGFEETVFLVE